MLPLGFAPNVTVTASVKAGTTLPRASWAMTVIGGAITIPAAAVEGAVMNASWVAT